MSLLHNCFVALTLACLTDLAIARELPPKNPSLAPLEGRLAAGLGVDGLVNCWNAMMELRSCTDEIVLFFMNGETHLGEGCCRAVSTITHHCWSTMLTSLGFTVGEEDVLRGYCDAEVASPPAPAASGVLAADMVASHGSLG